MQRPITPVRIHKIVEGSHVDGPGERTVVFFQGCVLACNGCQNKHLWPFESASAELWDATDLAARVARRSATGLVTLSGGDPFAQMEGLSVLAGELKRLGCEVLVYTGYRLDDELLNPLFASYYPIVRAALDSIDILVDGRFEKSLDHALISWRGSTNQRVIDVPATLQDWKPGAPLKIVESSWETAIIFTRDGRVLYPAGMSAELEPAFGPAGPTRRCGQTKNRKGEHNA